MTDQPSAPLADGTDQPVVGLLEALELAIVCLGSEHPADLQKYFTAAEFETIAARVEKMVDADNDSGGEVFGLLKLAWQSNKPGERICEPSAGSKYAPPDGSQSGVK